MISKEIYKNYEEAAEALKTAGRASAYPYQGENGINYALKSWDNEIWDGKESSQKYLLGLGYNVYPSRTFQTEDELRHLFDTKKNESDEQLRIQTTLLTGLHHILIALRRSSYGGWVLEGVDSVTKKSTWALRGDNYIFARIHFERPFYRDSVMIFKPPIIKDRVNESAMLFKVQNQTSLEMEKLIEKEIQTVTNVRANTSTAINWNISTSIEVGVSGTDANFGATALASLEASLGGEYKVEKEVGSGTQDTKKVSDTLKFPPWSESQVQMYYEKVSMSKEFTLQALADWSKITLEITQEPNQQDNCLIAIDASYEETSGWVALMSKLIGARNFRNNFFKSAPGDRLNAILNRENNLNYSKDVALQALLPYNRLLEFDGSVDYDNASDISLSVSHMGNYVWDADLLEYKLVRVV